VNSYLTDSGEQLNNCRANDEHRPLRITRDVLTNKGDNSKGTTMNITASNVVFLGST